MEPDNQPAFDLGALLQGYLNDLRTLARPAAERGDERPVQGREQLRQAAEHLRGEQARTAEQVNERYRQRTEAMQALAEERLQRLEAYARRQRQHVPAVPDAFVVAGRVTDQATGHGLPRVRVRTTDAGRRRDDRLGETRTDALGYFRLAYGASDLEERDQQPETRIEVLDDEGQVLFTSPQSFARKAGESVFVAAPVEGERVPTSRRLGEKVTQAVEDRRQDLSRRRRVLAHRPEVTLGATLRGTVEMPAPRPAPPLDLPVLVQQAGGAGAPAPKARTRKTETGKPAGRTRPKKADTAPPLTDVQGIGRVYRERLEQAGLSDARALASMKPARVAEILKVGEGRAESIVAAAKRAVGRGA